MKLTKSEKETIICYNEQEREAIVESCNKALIRRLDGLCNTYPDNCSLGHEDAHGKRFIIPKKWVRINPPRQSRMTLEQREAASARLKERHRIKKMTM